MQPVAGRPPLHQGDADGEHEAGERADIGDEGEEPRDHPDQDAEVQPDEEQADRVERAEDQADEALAAHEAGHRPVDLARETPRGRAVARRHPAVEGGDHPVPVVQHVEGDDRRDDEQRGDRDQRLAPGPERFEEGEEPCPALPHQRADGGLQLADHLRSADALKQRAGTLDEDALQLAHHGRQGVDQRGDLAGGERHHDDEQQHEPDDEARQDQQGRGEPAEAEPLQPVGERIEQVGERQPRHEGQHHLAQLVEQEDEDREDREPDDCSAAHRGLFLSVGRHGLWEA